MSFKSKFFRIANTVNSRFSFENLIQRLPFQDVILVYHLVSDEDLKHAKHLFPYRSVKQFQNDLDFLSKHFEFTDWDTFLKNKTESIKPKKPTILLTFDDGYAEFYDLIVPILRQKGIFAMNFINPKFIDNKDLMWRNKASLIVSEIEEHQKDYDAASVLDINYDQKNQLDTIAKELEINIDDYLKNQAVYLTSEQIVSLRNEGFGISSHGWDHPLYNQLPLENQLENTQKSLDFMTQNALLNDSFAFPFTDHLVGQAFFEEIFKKNPQLKYTFGAAGLKLDSFRKNLQRIPMESEQYAAQSILKNEIIYYHLLKKINKNRIIRG